MGVKVVVTNIFATEERSVVVDGVGLGYYRAVDIERTAFLKVHVTYLDADWDVGRRLAGENTPRANMGVQFLSGELDSVHRFGTMLVHFQLFLVELFAEVVGDAVAHPFFKFAVGFETDETANELGLLCPFQVVEDAHTVVGRLDFVELHFQYAPKELVAVVCHKAVTNAVAFL